MDSLRVGVWKDRVTSALGSFPEAAPEMGIDAVFMSAADAERELLAGRLDVALLPSTTVLRGHNVFDILPAVAISSWGDQSALISKPELIGSRDVVLKGGDRHPIFELIAAVILKEHYGLKVVDGDSEHMEDNGSDQGLQSVRLLPSTDEFDAAADIDLSQEWTELANYPMVWALFATRKESATSDIIERVRDWVLLVESRLEGAENERRPVDEAVRMRLDDLAVASLAELGEFLYYYGDSEQIPTFEPVSLSDPEAE